MRTHNAFYLPGAATHLVLDVRDSGPPGYAATNAMLRIELGQPGLGAPLNSTVYQIPLDERLLADGQVIIPLLDIAQVNKVLSLRVQLVGASDQTQITIDNVHFEARASGRSNDVIWVELPKLLTEDQQQAMTSFDIAKLAIDGKKIERIKADEYRVLDDRRNLLGTILLAERFGRAAFAGSGAFAFVPYIAPTPSSKPFTGSLLLRLDGQALSRLDVGSDRSQPLTSNIVLGTADPVDVARVQQRLRALGYTGVSGAPWRSTASWASTRALQSASSIRTRNSRRCRLLPRSI